LTRTARALTPGEIALARGVFGDAIDYAQVRIVLGKWAFFQPRDTVMAPRGCIHFHPKGTAYRDDFSAAPLSAQGLFIHEMVHVWQHQRGIFLPIRRHPFSRYDYAIRPGVALAGYGIEQQAEIVRHAFVLRCGGHVIGAPGREVYEGILPFGTGGSI
jgi:hypothetical protein